MAASDDLLNQWKQEQQLTAAPAGATTTNTTGSDALLNSWKNDLESNITVSVQNAAKGNPERAAEVQKVARALLVPTDVVDKNWDNLSAFAKTRQFQMQRDAAEDPILAHMYANPDFAAVAVDDYLNVSQAGKAIRNLGKQPERTFTGTLQDIGVTAGKGIIGTGEAAVGLADIATKGWVGKQMQNYLGYDPKASKEFLETFYSEAQKYANQNVAEAKGILPKLEAALSNPSVIATTIGESIPLMLGGGAIGRGLGLMRGLAGNAITRSAIGEGAISAGSIAEQTRQGDGIPNITIFGEPAEPGRLTTEQALASVVGGAATTLIAQVGAKAAQRLGITDIDVLVTGGNTYNPALNKSLGRQIIEGGIVEGFFQEMPQSAVEQLVSNYAQGKPIFEGMDDALVMGTLAGIAMGGGGPVVAYPANVRADREAARQAEQKAQLIEMLAQHTEASNLLKRDPESFQNYIEQVSEDGAVQNVYIKASVLQQLGLIDQVAAVIPAVAEQVQQAVSPEQEIQIPVAEYAAKIAPTEANAVLLDNLRVEGETMTRAEANAFIENESETLQKAYEKAQNTKLSFDEFKKSAKAVESDLANQFGQVGLFTPADNKVQAALYSRVFSMLAIRLNQTPEQVYEKYKTTIAAEGQMQVGQALNQDNWSNIGKQGDMFAGELADKDTQVDTGIVISSKGDTLKGGNVNNQGRQITGTKQGLSNFWNWFGNSAAAEKGKPMVVYHTTRSDVSKFETMRESENSDNLGGTWKVWRSGIFFTPNLDYSQSYGSYGGKYETGANVMPVYLSIQNPIDFRQYAKYRDELAAALEAKGLNANYASSAATDWELFDNYEDSDFGQKFVETLKELGYDGAIITEQNADNEDVPVYVAFDPEQIKSVTGNIGTFDPNSPEVFKQPLPEDKLWRNWEPEVTSTGKIKGSPEWVNNEKDLAKMRRSLRKFVNEGMSGRYWYEQSADAVMRMVGGDVVKAEKFIQLLAIYSPNSNVWVNTIQAVRAYTHWSLGLPADTFSVGSGDADSKAVSVLYNNAEWDGRKTNSFYLNLMHDIVLNYPEEVKKLNLDPSFATELSKPATIDVWMARAFGYEVEQFADDKGTGKYSFAENEVRRLTARLNSELPAGADRWTPHQVQAAIWTGMKTRYELKEVKEKTNAKSLREGLIKIEDGKPVYPKVAEERRKHLANWRHFAMQPTTEQVTQAADENARSFGDDLARLTEVVTWEAMPSEAFGYAVNKADPAVLQMFTAEAQSLLVDENGNDLLAYKLGVPMSFASFGAGAYAGGVNPNVLSHLLPMREKDQKGFNVNEVRAYARAIQYIYKQDAVPWFRPDNKPLTAKKAIEDQKFRVVNKTVGRTLKKFDTQAEAEAYAASKGNKFEVRGGDMARAIVFRFENALDRARLGDVLSTLQKYLGEDAGYTRTADNEIIVVNFRDDKTKVPFARTDEQFIDALGEFMEKDGAALGVAEQSAIWAQGEYGNVHNWSKDSEGSSLLDSGGLAGRPDLQTWLRGRRDAFDALLDKYSGDNLGKLGQPAGVLFQGGLGPDGASVASYRGPDQAVGGRSYGTATEGSVARLGYHFSREPRTTLDGRAHGTGLTAQERVRLAQADDARIKERIYFYVDNGNGIKPESGVGANAHSVNLNNLYDIKADPLGLRAAAAAKGTDPDGVWFNAVESAIIDAGFDGYVSDTAQTNQGVAVLLGRHAVEVDQIQAPGYTQPAPRTMPDRAPVFKKYLNQNEIFYSALQRAFEGVKQGSMPADQWIKWLSSNQPKLGVKKEEIEATGLREYLELNGKDKLTKEQIVEFLQNNGVRVEEVVRGDQDKYWNTVIGKLENGESISGYSWDDQNGDLLDGNGYSIEGVSSIEDAADYVVNRTSDTDAEYAQYQLPGGRSYKELLLTLPVKARSVEEIEREWNDMPISDPRWQSLADERQRALGKGAYQSPHWKEANVLAHIRFNERTDADGKRVLFIEEIQSDWAQEGRKKGFQASKDELGEGYTVAEETGSNGQVSWVVRDPQGRSVGFGDTRIEAIRDLNANPRGVPKAPFVKDTKAWVGLAIKRMIRYAADNKIDKVAFVNGDQSAERYDLSQQVSAIQYRKNEDGTFKASAIFRRQENENFGDNLTVDQLEDYVGKEVAAKIAAGDGESVGSGPYKQLSGIDLKVGGEGMKSFYDKIVPQVTNDVLKKLGGGKVETVQLPDGNQQLGFTITPAMREAVLAGQALFQPSRGYIDPKNLMVILTQNADRSTPGHELAHAVVEIYTRIANTEDAPAEIISDLDQLLVFAGVQGADQKERLASWSAMTLDEQRPFHEAIAYNWEIYLAEGKAPSVELQSVFDRLSQWIRDLYTVVRDHLNGIYKAEFGKDMPIMTEGVREVFDRMLASEEQIQQAETVRNMQVLFESKPEGMDDAQWAALQQLAAEARDMSISKLTTDSLRQMRWLSNAKMRVIKQMQREALAIRVDVEREVEAEIKKSPVYKAVSYIVDGVEVLPDGTTREATGPHKISIAGLEDLYMGNGDRYALLDWSQLPRKMYGAEGMHPDALAELLGFQSGDQLVRTLIESPSLKEAVRKATDARMLAEHGEMNTQREIDLAVERALHNEARARFVAAELRFVSRATAPARAMIQAAKRAAQNIINTKLIKDLKPSEYGIAEARANKEAMTAQKKGDDKAVLSAMQSALLNNQLAAVAADTRSQIDKGLVYLRKVTSDANRKRIGADAGDQIDALLSRFDLSAPGSTVRSMSEWVAKVTEAGFDPSISPDMLNDNFRKPFKMMSVKEFNDLMDAVRQIEHLGRNEQMMLTAAKDTAYKEARDQMVESINANANGRTADVRTAKTKLGKMAQGLHRFFAEHIKAATIARILDGGKEGPVWEYLIRPANAAADRETAMRAEATRDITEILAPVLKSKMGGKGVLVPSIGRALNKEERIAVALNMGNEGNIQRLLSGENWTIEQVTPILESLTAAELEAVQKIWDYSEHKHKPLIAEQWRRLYGREPEWVEPRPMTVKSADGQVVNLRGGYYPIVYDPRASQRAGELYDAEAARMEMQGFISATISTSFAKSRVQMVKDRPLLLSLAGVYNGINDVIHALSWQEYIIDANRLLRSFSIDQAIRTQYGPEFKQQLKAWVKDVAVGERAAQEGGTQAINFVRQSVSAAGLGFNIMSALQQVTGFSSSIVKIGARYTGRGIAKTMANPAAAIKMVYEKSTFMANRGRTQFRELNELRNMVQGENSVARGVKVGTYFMMAQMQRMVDIPTWIGAYEKAIGEGNDEARAIALADQAVIDSQGGGMLKDLAKIERGGPWLKLFTVFYSYMGTQFNLATAEAMTERSKGKLAAKMLMLTIVPVVLAYAIKHGLTPDDEDEWDWEKIAKELASENLAYLMGMMIIVRELGSAAKVVVGAEGGNRGYGGPAGTRMISDLYTFATQAKQGDFDDAFRKAAINLLGDFTGLPSAQINRTINGVDALIEGKTSNPAAVFTGFEKR